MKIVFLSNQLFDYPLKTNKWHVATRMAALGHDVLFVDPPIRFRKFLKQVFQGRWSLRRILTFTYRPWGDSNFWEDSDLRKGAAPRGDLIVYTPVGLIPFSGSDLDLSKMGPFGRVLDTFLKSLNQCFHVRRIRNILSRFQHPSSIFPARLRLRPARQCQALAGGANSLAGGQFPLLWVYHVEMGGLEDYVDAIPHDLLIYDCVDNYPAFPRYRNNPKLKNWIIGREEWLAKKADLIFTTAPGLQERLSKLNKNTFYVGNAGDYNRFASKPAEGETLRVGGPEPEGLVKIGFSGALDAYKINLPLLVKIAKAYPDYSLALIGPTGVADDEPNLKELKSLPNVQLLGEKPYEEMPNYFSQFDVYIIPYNLNEYTLGGCFPVKFFDALAAGLPTVVTGLPCYQDFSEVCYVAKDEDDFVRSVKIAVEENSAEKISARQKIAKQNSWDRKVEKMVRIVEEHT